MFILEIITEDACNKRNDHLKKKKNIVFIQFTSLLDNVPTFSPPGKVTKVSKPVERVSSLSENAGQTGEQSLANKIHQGMSSGRYHSKVLEISHTQQWMFRTDGGSQLPITIAQRGTQQSKEDERRDRENSAYKEGLSAEQPS